MIARRTSAPIRFITRGSFLSLCLLAFLACDARTAQATCGDYLHGHGSAAASDASSQIAMPTANPVQHPIPGPKCTGPQCQQNRQSPATPTKSIQVPVSSDGVLMTVSPLTGVDEFSCRNIGSDDHPITGFAIGIFRPPQAA